MRAKRATHPGPWTLVVMLLAVPAASGADDAARMYLDQGRTVGPAPQSATERFTFVVDAGGPYPHLELSIQMTRGRADVRVVDPTGRQVQSVGAQQATLDQPLVGATARGAYGVEVTTTDAVGQWRLRVYGGPEPDRPPPGPAVASGASMMAVAVAAVWFWRRRTGVAWRWFWAGAAVWAVAVAAKLAIAFALNGPLVRWLKGSLPHWAYLSAGSLYGGALTGVTEVLFTYLAALIWRRMAATADRAVAVGVGAGAFEAALLAVAAASAAFIPGAGAVSWSVALAPAAERVIAILCHVASRCLALLAVVARRPALFACGFVLLSAIDAVAMLLHLSGRVGTTSPWVVEALLAPFAVVCVPITIWCVRRWPAPPAPADPPGAEPGAAPPPPPGPIASP